MWAIVEAAGWPIWTIIAASVVSLAIILERLYTLRRGAAVPQGLLAQTLQEYRRVGDKEELLQRLQGHSPLGRLFAAGLRNVHGSREVMKEAIEDEGRQVAYQLERLLTTLGTIAAMAPLLGLLGTVIGMIEIFGSQNASGANPQQLAHGISVALYNTAFGLIVAIPSMMFYRYFRSKVDGLLVEMEAQAVKLVEVAHGERKNGS
ncbi:MotA/TolQ/ExbB proton channel family protein [Chromobacterium violaceum]|uniref:Biopolymer transport protein exbB n=3 Tax=Chromobacterium TaxID=535 RepID=A0A1R0MQ68_CHRVL|nr:MotA/TolQ/ExbB proton channel family protein [Chromobacterium violaceum]AAQ61012.1 probable exbB-like biopolymer transport [Chromobacterium violaceum ATCC 12472]ATP29658.1 MotA/TolQ/ExbB proton channel family protein [Chromobacterium violaceum]ATP33566.1 MotA/TolQ/ExbB proton channel family protein [Chromobacterium violaceum]KJH66739.1 flagellar motor protein MotA [Chromobacterium violaceum]KMN48926.1 flagellar motor protein MotA [Chromobacterium violaceum]